MAKIYSELEFGDPAWVIRKVHIDNQFIDDTGRYVIITEDGDTIMEDETDLVAILPALDE
jgi:hypothetical protein